MGIALWIALETSITSTADRDLQARLAEVRRYVDSFSPDDLRHLEDEFREESLLSQSIANIRIADFNGHWLFQTPSAESWQVDLHPGNRTLRVGNQHVRILTAPIKVGVVQIGLVTDQFEQVKDGFLWTMAFASPILLGLSALGGYWLSGRALRPVDEISQAAQRISAQDLSARLPSTGIGDELDRLSSVLNDMLHRLESAFHRIAEFTADASHELRTPVAVIQTTSELMQDRPRTVEEHKTAWHRVHSETERTAQLLADLLLLARSDVGQASLALQPMDLAPTIQEAVEEMRVLADARNIQLTVHAGGPCPITGDPESLRRVICILLDNAIKFTPEQGSVEVKWILAGKAIVAVTDTGVGIAPDDLPKVFDRFYRVSKDRSRNTGGVGLGLAIARSIIEQHGGKIDAGSQLGQGSVFTISFPA